MSVLVISGFNALFVVCINYVARRHSFNMVFLQYLKLYIYFYQVYFKGHVKNVVFILGV